MKIKWKQNKAKNRGFFGALRRVAPFLFTKGKRNPSVKTRHHSRDTTTAHHVKHRKIKHTSRLPAATGEARKRTDATITTAEQGVLPELPALDLESPKQKGKFILQDDYAPVDEESVKEALLQEQEEGETHLVVADKNEGVGGVAASAEILANAKEDAFLSKVALKEENKSVTKKVNGWTLLKNRFLARRSELVPKEKIPEDTLDSKEVATDTFLQRVQKKDVHSVVGTTFDNEQFSGLEEMERSHQYKNEEQIDRNFKGGTLSAAELRNEARSTQEATKRLEKEVQDIKKEMKFERKTSTEEGIKKVEPPKKEVAEEAVHVGKHIGQKKKNGFQQFMASVGYIGLGKERSQFIQNLATMLNAGLPLIEAIKTLQMETKPKPMKQLLQRVVDMVDNGSPLWRAMEAQSFFSPHSLALIRIGEEAGNLAGNMEYLAAQDEKDHELKSKVQMAMIYPIIVMSIMAVIVVVLGMFVLPNLIGVLTSLNVPLPLATRIVIMVSNGFTEYGYIGIPCSLVGLFILIILNKYTSLKIVVQWVTFRIPGVGKLARQATIARFGVILGGLLKAGVPVTEALDSLIDVTTIVVYRTFYVRLLDHINVGDSFAKSFGAMKHSDKLLPPSVQQLVITGEKSGALADIMLKISDIYDKKATETAQKLPVILEPLLLLFIGSLVGTIAFAILVPIYSIVGNIGH